MTRTRNTLLVLSLAIAGASLAACNKDTTDDTTAADVAATQAAATAADSMPPAYDGTAGIDDAGMAGDMITTGPITDQQFYQQAMAGNLKEIAAGNMAIGNAGDPDVKAYARTLVDDHTAMNQTVVDEAGMADAATPAPDPSATAGLQGTTGADFDRAYIDMMVADHQQAVAMFENAAENASTQEARTLATEALPKLREHLQRARELQGQVGGDTGTAPADDGTVGT